MKLILTIDIDPERIKNQRDAAKCLRLVACDVEQGMISGSIRNLKTKEETDRWMINIVK